MTERDELTDEAVRLISDAAQESLVLRALGSVGVKLHCDKVAADLRNRGRLPKDIDLVTRKKDRRRLRDFFENRGYETDRDMLVAMEGSRYLFRNRISGIDVDVWVEVLDFCHRIDVADRLGPGPCLTIEDLLLSKLQIVELMDNDRHDLMAILGSHDVGLGSNDPETIDADYVASILAADWGFWRTATNNLDVLRPELSPEATQQVALLQKQFDATPKSLRWRARARVGERAQWWQDVEIPRDTY